MRTLSRLVPLFLSLLCTAQAGPPARLPAVHGDLWLNSAPLAAADFAGRVVLVEFWTFGCGNCRNVEPYIKRWHARYSDRGLLVIAVHSPEFPREAEPDNVRAYVREHGIAYPVPVDNGFVTWRRFDNHAWPALYLAGRDGRVRYSHIGEGAYDRTEKIIQALLDEE